MLSLNVQLFTTGSLVQCLTEPQKAQQLPAGASQEWVLGCFMESLAVFKALWKVFMRIFGCFMESFAVFRVLQGVF